MAYLVEILIRNRPQIRSKHDSESDDYNNLLILESKISELLSKRVLSQGELEVLNLLSLGYSIGDIKLKLHLDRDIVAERIRKITDKVAYYLGGPFTDEGYLDYMQEKYCLSSVQLEALKSFINSKYYNRIARKIHDKPSK